MDVESSSRNQINVNNRFRDSNLPVYKYNKNKYSNYRKRNQQIK